MIDAYQGSMLPDPRPFIPREDTANRNRPQARPGSLDEAAGVAALAIQGLEINMRPFLHPTLVNGRFGDPALYVETLFEKRAILFDLGDITALSPRKIQRLEHVLCLMRKSHSLAACNRALAHGPPGRISGRALAANLPAHMPQRMADRARAALCDLGAPIDIKP